MIAYFEKDGLRSVVTLDETKYSKYCDAELRELGHQQVRRNHSEIINAIKRRKGEGK